jgi:MYXO-CTERM domain-containing protein
MPSSSQFVRRFASLACVLMIGLVAAVAGAAGRVQWKTTKLKETSGKAWNVECAIFLPRKPDVAHLPMKFEFEPISYFERAMVDGKEGPQERTVPLQGRQSLIESVDVGFMDPGTGQIQSRTKFVFKVTRAHGYEAGEYKVTIRDGSNGSMVGTPTTLTFNGENEIIDRRSIVFTGEKKKKPKTDEKGEGEKSGEASGDKAEEKKDEGSSAGGGDKSEESSGGGEAAAASDDEGEPSPGDAPDEVNGKPGGCGCRMPGSPSAGGTAVLGVLVLFSALLLRRRGY